MAKLTGRHFRELAKVAALNEAGGRYLFALRSDGTILRRRTTEPADSSYHRWSTGHTGLATKQDLIDIISRTAGWTIESTRAEQRRERIVHEQKCAVRSDVKPNECWACRGVAEESAGFMPRVFRIFESDGPEAARKYIDERLSVAHQAHKRSWV